MSNTVVGAVRRIPLEKPEEPMDSAESSMSGSDIDGVFASDRMDATERTLLNAADSDTSERNVLHERRA